MKIFPSHWRFGAALPLLFFGLYCSPASWAQGNEEDWRLYRVKDEKSDTADRQIHDADGQMGTKSVALIERYERSVDRSPGTVRVYRDARIDLLDSLRKEHPKSLEGYRVQLFFGSRAEAQKIRGEFLKKYPDVAAYVSYLAPNFRLRVGDFRDKLSSEALREEIKKEYPNAYIVRDEINLPPLRSTNSKN